MSKKKESRRERQLNSFLGCEVGIFRGWYIFESLMRPENERFRAAPKHGGGSLDSSTYAGILDAIDERIDREERELLQRWHRDDGIEKNSAN